MRGLNAGFPHRSAKRQLGRIVHCRPGFPKIFPTGTFAMPSAVTGVYRKPFFRPGFAVAGMTLLKQNETGKAILNSGQVEAARAQDHVRSLFVTGAPREFFRRGLRCKEGFML
jgi:hypothetical protein